MNTYITRILKKNKKYHYYLGNNKIKDKNILKKLEKIYIAPAYTNVKIYLDQKILATGINSAGRMQYVYSDKSKIKREVNKYKKLKKISDKINILQRQINHDLLENEFTKNKLIALILKIMDLCNFRSGNKTYEKKYGSYGITTIHKKHVKIGKSNIKIDFIGKKGVQNNCIIKNPTIQKIIKKVYQISSKDDPYLFSIYYHEKKINVSFYDINQYLKPFDITCKDLRTWNANILFLKYLKKEVYLMEKYNFDLKMRKKIIRSAIQECAKSLHNTVAVCKSSYICKNIVEKMEKDNKIILTLMNKNIDYEIFLKNIL